jgi:Fe-S-cluster containining protein
MSVLHFDRPLDLAQRLEEDVPLQRCDLLECRAACCEQGVWLDLQEVQDLQAHAAEISQFLEAERRNPMGWFGGISEEDATVPSGRVLPSATVPKPDRLRDSECVFLRRDYRCSLQLASEALGHHRWRFKPFYCLMHPLTLEGDARLTLATTEDLIREPASCLRTAPQTRPIESLLEEEFTALREAGRIL